MNKLYITLILFMLLIPNVNAYWNKELHINNETSNSIIKIGEWIFNHIDEGWNLNVWEEEEVLNQVIPEGQIFSYDTILYIVRSGETYNPEWHGLPGEGSNQWAYVALQLEWLPNMNYRTNSVVIRDGRYFIANHAYNNDWFVGDPFDSLNRPWSEWLEIEPLLDSYFGYLDEYPTVKDYRANVADVVYK